jgi:DNA polymerase
MSDDDRASPPPLAEARRRAYLEAMGIPIWVPRGAAAEAPPAATPSGDAPEPAAAEAKPPQPDLEEPPPMSAALADAWADQAAAPEPADAAPTDAPATGVARMDWATLEDAIRACTACRLCETRTQAVPGVGAPAAQLLIIGEAPGQEEDRQGEPFVGRAGQLLDRMLAAIGLDRSTVFITNVLKCRPPKNRDPNADEIQACAPYLRRQIELMAPRAILAVGRVSAQNLLETGDAIGRLRGRWHTYGPRSTPLWVTYHPAYLLRNPAAKGKAWSDLKAVRECLRS